MERTTGSKKTNVARNNVIAVEKKVVGPPVVHSESEIELDSTNSDTKSDSEESECVYENIDHNHRFLKIVI